MGMASYEGVTPPRSAPKTKNQFVCKQAPTYLKIAHGYGLVRGGDPPRSTPKTKNQFVCKQAPTYLKIAHGYGLVRGVTPPRSTPKTKQKYGNLKNRDPQSEKSTIKP